MDDFPSTSQRGRSISPSTSMPRTKRICTNTDPYYIDSEDDGDFSYSENGDTTWKPSEHEDFEHYDLEDFEQSAVSHHLSDYRPTETLAECVTDSNDEQLNIAVIDNNNTIEIDQNRNHLITCTVESITENVIDEIGTNQQSVGDDQSCG